MESGQARVHSGVRPLAPLARPSRSPITPAWLQSPEHLRRPGDFRSYCHAPARLWTPEPSTDSLDLTHNRPTRGARLFQTGSSARSGAPGPSGVRTAVRPSGQLGLLPSGLHRECTILLQVGLWSFMEFHKTLAHLVRLCTKEAAGAVTASAV